MFPTKVNSRRKRSLTDHLNSTTTKPAEAFGLPSPSPSTPPKDDGGDVPISDAVVPVEPSIHGKNQLKCLSQHAARVEGLARASEARRSWYRGNTSSILLLEVQAQVQSDLHFLEAAIADLTELLNQRPRKMKASMIENYLEDCERIQHTDSQQLRSSALADVLQTDKLKKELGEIKIMLRRMNDPKSSPSRTAQEAAKTKERPHRTLDTSDMPTTKKRRSDQSMAHHKRRSMGPTSSASAYYDRSSFSEDLTLIKIRGKIKSGSSSTSSARRLLEPLSDSDSETSDEDFLYRHWSSDDDSSEEETPFRNSSKTLTSTRANFTSPKVSNATPSSNTRPLTPVEPKFIDADGLTQDDRNLLSRIYPYCEAFGHDYQNRRLGIILARSCRRAGNIEEADWYFHKAVPSTFVLRSCYRKTGEFAPCGRPTWHHYETYVWSGPGSVGSWH